MSEIDNKTVSKFFFAFYIKLVGLNYVIVYILIFLMYDVCESVQCWWL